MKNVKENEDRPPSGSKMSPRRSSDGQPYWAAVWESVPEVTLDGLDEALRKVWLACRKGDR